MCIRCVKAFNVKTLSSSDKTAATGASTRLLLLGHFISAVWSSRCSPSHLLPLFSVKAADWFGEKLRHKRSPPEVGKTDERDCRAEIWAIQLQGARSGDADRSN